jgi:serine/threonine-protein kinase
LTELQPKLPADVAAVVARCLAKDPFDRYPSATDFDRALAACSCGVEWEASL